MDILLMLLLLWLFATLVLGSILVFGDLVRQRRYDNQLRKDIEASNRYYGRPKCPEDLQ